MTVHQRPRKQQKVFRSLADLSSISGSGTSGDNTNDAVTTLGASAAKVVTADSSGAHVVVTLGAETPDQNLVTAAPAAIVPQPETLKEIIMNANTIETTSNIENAAGAAAPVAPTATEPAPAKSALGITLFAPDFDFSSNGAAANVRLHELGNAAVVLDGRMTAVERQLANLQKSGLSGDLTVSTEKSWEDIGYKVGAAAATGAAVYAGVKLAQWVFDSPAAE